ncbi:tyrosine-type recombinase/integrase [Pseudomonas sp. F1_0610]|uniref:tyrosine-type recombinase/integrase n=1 Tax=Pseudomonas sp. F1_0610 TaxID=3114284 RepID=UPI0039C18A2C
MSTLAVPITDAEIKRQAANDIVTTLRDPRYQGLRYRYLADRTRGSWFLIINGKWERIGAFPVLTSKQVINTLPELLTRKAVNAEASLCHGDVSRCKDLLIWYRDRVKRNSNLSQKRRLSVEIILDKHLLPALQDTNIDEINRDLIDRQLIWSLQESYSVSYVRQIMRVLQQAFNQALKLNRITNNPLASFKFAEFVQAKEKPKTGRLRPIDLDPLLAHLKHCYALKPVQGLFALMMLAHGTRIGETRLTRWRDISLSERVWFIPAENTKTRVEHTLPLTDQVCALLTQYRERMKGRAKDYLFVDEAGCLLTERQAGSSFQWLSQGKWSSHDLRKLARTCWAELGVDYLIGERLLNHQVGALVQTYVLTTQEELKRQALENWCARLDECGFSEIHNETGVRSGIRENLSKAK